MPEKYQKKLQALMNAVAESVAEASDEDIVSEAEAAGESVAETAERLRASLHKVVTEHKKRKLVAARKEYYRRVKQLQESTPGIPGSARERRTLLQMVFSWKPKLQEGALTAQYRDFQDLADSDVKSLLEQFSELGILEEFRNKGRDDPADSAEVPPDTEAD